MTDTTEPTDVTDVTDIVDELPGEPPRPIGAPPRPAHTRDRTLQYHSPSAARPMSAGRVLQVGAIALLVGALLNADSLYATASSQPFGWERTVSRGMVVPFRTVSHWFHLNAPRSTIERAIGHNPEPGSSVHTGISRKPKVVIKAAAAPPTFHIRKATAADPLRVWIGGDSMTQVFGQSFLAKLGTRPTAKPVLDYRISTGLTRPDYFDWPAELADHVLPTKPEVMVVMFGANDAQGMQIPSGVFQVNQPEWQAEYRRRVGDTMDLLAGDGRLVVWVGTPYMRDPGFNQRMTILNDIYQSEAAKRPWVKFFDSRPVLASPGSTSYEAYLPDSSGQLQLARQSDGIHLSRFGGDRLADAVIKQIDDLSPKYPRSGVPGHTYCVLMHARTVGTGWRRRCPRPLPAARGRSSAAARAGPLSGG